MSVGIAAAMVRAACKYQKAQVTADIEEATKQFAPFQPQLLHTPEAFSELILLTPLLLCIDLACYGLRQIMIVFKVCSGSKVGKPQQHAANHFLHQLWCARQTNTL